MAELLSAAQMRAVEQAAIDRGDVTGLELMERAGRGVVAAIFEAWPELERVERGASPSRSPEYLDKDEGRKALVLCGPGNNGGDGFVVARLLRERGWTVDVFLYGDPEKLPPDARVNYERWGALGEVVSLSSAEMDGLNALYQRQFDGSPELIVDAFFGTGLTRPLPHIIEDIQQDVFGSMNANGTHPLLVAIDVPSGLCADSGRWLGHNCPNEDEEFAHLTVSFHTEKTGHRLADAPNLCGKVVVVDIGLPSFFLAEILPPEAPDRTQLTDGQLLHADLSKQNGHKFSHGHALVLSGGAGRTGAARLAARGALRIGAGLVTLGVPGAAQMEVAGQITALMLRRVEDGAGLSDVLEDARFNAVCLGPGLGLSDSKAQVVAAALKAKRATVLDADALTLIAQDKDLFDALHERCVLTPHAGEFGRLFPDLKDRLDETPTRGPAYSKVDATRAAAQRAGCTVLFKGPDTVIADPSGQCAINSAQYARAAPWLATAGSGDVLAGFITGLLARGFAPMQAAEMAAWLHVDCALSFGPGLIAEDIPEEVPKVLRALGV